MKMALDYWYELWENAQSKGGTALGEYSDKENRYYPQEEENLAWMQEKEPGSNSR